MGRLLERTPIGHHMRKEQWCSKRGESKRLRLRKVHKRRRNASIVALTIFARNAKHLDKEQIYVVPA